MADYESSYTGIEIDEGISKANTALQSTNIATSISSASTNSQCVGAKLFYDTVGDIETLLSEV